MNSPDSQTPLACRCEWRFRFALATSIVLSSLPIFASDFEPPEAATQKSKSPVAWLPRLDADHTADADRTADAALERADLIPTIAITDVPKVTADKSKFDKEYLIELDRFKISNDGQNAKQTSQGLNAALRYAKSINANRIVFPPGLYLIGETDPVLLDHQNAIIDLNGATLKITPNGLKEYSIIDIVPGAENLRLTNGTLLGDKTEHDFSAAKGSHEWGHGLVVHGGCNLEIDHLTVTNVTGDGVSTRTTGARSHEELVSMIVHSVKPQDLESGGFTAAGTKAINQDRIRTIHPIDVTKCGGEFEFGYSSGYCGYPFIQDRNYQVYFLDDQHQLVASRNCLQFRKVEVPENARFAHLEFNQPDVPPQPLHAGASRNGPVGRLSNFRGSVDVHFHHNTLAANRRLGLGYCGGRRWLIEDCHFTGNGDVSPGFGIDLEDGWEMMQDVVIRNNRFSQNKAGDLVICAGSELLIEGNRFTGTVAVHGRPHNYTFRKNEFQGGKVNYSTRTGVADIRDNRYENCSLSIRFDTASVADGLVRSPGEVVATPPLTLKNETLRSVKLATGTYLDFLDSDFANVKLLVGKETHLVRLINCQVEATSIRFDEAGPPVQFQVELRSGTLSESGPGLHRKQSLPSSTGGR